MGYGSNAINPSTRVLELQNGDRLLLCSDGLTEEVIDDLITDILTDNPDANEAASQLIATANARGGNDNISAIVINVGDQIPHTSSTTLIPVADDDTVDTGDW